MQVKIGLWIDLTKTGRFYRQKLVEEQGCKYVKLPCKGHGESPDAEVGIGLLYIPATREFQKKLVLKSALNL